MKTTIFISLLLFTSILCGQTVIDMANDPIENETKNGTYYTKDVNNYMQPFVGTWQYIDSNTKFRITLTKVEMYHVVIPEANIDYYTDDITIQYKKYEDGILVFDSPVFYGASVIQGFRVFDMSFTDYERDNESFDLELTLISTGLNEQNELKFSLDKFETRNTYYETHPNEPYFSVPNNIVMTRME